MSKKTIQQVMRNLHRDVGFLVIGLTLMYALSGILLIYRHTDFLRFDQQIEKTLPQNLSADDLARELRMRNLQVTSETEELISFSNGDYNKTTGLVQYTIKAHPAFMNKMNSLHKRGSEKAIHWFSVVYAISLLFLAISSFWMFKPGSKKFKRGIILTLAGLAVAIILLYM